MKTPLPLNRQLKALSFLSPYRFFLLAARTTILSVSFNFPFISFISFDCPFSLLSFHFMFISTFLYFPFISLSYLFHVLSFPFLLKSFPLIFHLCLSVFISDFLILVDCKLCLKFLLKSLQNCHSFAPAPKSCSESSFSFHVPLISCHCSFIMLSLPFISCRVRFVIF